MIINITDNLGNTEVRTTRELLLQDLRCYSRILEGRAHFDPVLTDKELEILTDSLNDIIVRFFGEIILVK